MGRCQHMHGIVRVCSSRRHSALASQVAASSIIKVARPLTKAAHQAGLAQPQHLLPQVLGRHIWSWASSLLLAMGINNTNTQL